MSNQDSCSLCSDHSVYENPILKCEKCDLRVHALCYGIQNGKFVCSPCAAEVDAKTIQCAICQKSEGAMKKSTNGGWVHVICGLFTKDVEFCNIETMEPIDVSKLKQSKKRKCFYCEGPYGTFKCMKRGCVSALHASCGLKMNSLKEEIGENDEITFLGYCADHMPDKSSKRLSSDALNLIISSKTLKKNTLKAAKANNQWVVEKIGRGKAEESTSKANLEPIPINETTQSPSGETVEPITGQSSQGKTEKNKSKNNEKVDIDEMISAKIADPITIVEVTYSPTKNIEPQDDVRDVAQHEKCNVAGCYKDALIKKVSKKHCN